MRLQRRIFDEVARMIARALGQVTSVPQPPLGVAVIPPLGGDVTGSISATTVEHLQGIPVSATDPTEGQVLKAVSGTWMPAADVGFANPMTTAEDLIKGGVSGAPARLAVGTTGTVLKVVAGVVAWAAEIVSALASSVVTETAFGQSSAVGVATTAARGDHTHGTPTNPITAHEAAANPHPDYTTTAELATAVALLLAKSLIDAKGDLILGTANDVPARLAVGTDGQILYADSTQAAGVRWDDAPTGGGSSHWEVVLLDGEPVTLDGSWLYMEVLD